MSGLDDRLRSRIRVAPRYRLTYRMAVLGLAIASACVVLLYSFQRFEGEGTLRRMSEALTLTLRQTVLNYVVRHYPDHIEAIARLEPEAIRAHPRTAELIADLRLIAAGSNVLKVKFYDRRGTTIFSTELAQIGADYGRKPAFRSALRGEATSELERRATFNAMEGPVANRHLYGTYLPVPPGATPHLAVMEIYVDVTGPYAAMRGHIERAMAIIIATLLACYAGLVTGVSQAERAIRRQHAENVEFLTSVAHAEASANNAKSQFLATMSHELRTPLNAIIGFSEIMKLEKLGLLGGERYRDYAAGIHDSGVHLLNIINQILDLAKIEAGAMDVDRQTVDVKQIAEAAFKLIEERAARGKIDVRISAETGTAIESDPVKLRQIFVNLLSNAVKFTPEGGRIAVSLAPADAPGRFRVAVSDTGIGMRADEIDVALTPFRQVDGRIARRFEGTGLGLPLTKRLVEILGGTFKIESAPGVGTIVQFELPRGTPS